MPSREVFRAPLEHRGKLSLETLSGVNESSLWREFYSYVYRKNLELTT